MNPESLKIGIVLPAVPGYSETFFRSKIRGLQANGHEVILFVRNGDRKVDIDCRVVVAPRLSGNPIQRLVRTLGAIAKVKIKAFGPTLRFWKWERRSGSSMVQATRRLAINAHILPYKLDWIHFGFATMAVDSDLVGKAIGARMAVSFRGYDINLFPLKNQGVYDRLWKNVDKVHSISRDLYQKAIQLGLSEEVPHSIITPAIDLKGFPYCPHELFKDGKVRLLTVSRLHWIKGLEDVIRSVGLLKDRGIDVHLTLVGEGSELERLTLAAHQEGVEDQVDFRGRVDHEKIPDLLKSHDVFIQYSFEEGFCNAVLEAQGSGILTVVSDGGGLKENVLDDQTGWIVPKRDPEALAERIASLVEKRPDDLLRITDIARERVERDFSLEKQQREFVSFYL